MPPRPLDYTVRNAFDITVHGNDVAKVNFSRGTAIFHEYRYLIAETFISKPLESPKKP